MRLNIRISQSAQPVWSEGKNNWQLDDELLIPLKICEHAPGLLLTLSFLVCKMEILIPILIGINVTIYLEVVCACAFVDMFMGSWELNPEDIGE